MTRRLEIEGRQQINALAFEVSDQIIKHVTQESSRTNEDKQIITLSTLCMRNSRRTMFP